MRITGEKIIPIWSKNRKNRSTVNIITEEHLIFTKKILSVSLKVKQRVFKL